MIRETVVNNSENRAERKSGGKNEKEGNTRIKGTKHKTFRLRREKRRKQQN